MNALESTTVLQDFFNLPHRHDKGQQPGITCVCSAHPLVIKTTLEQARKNHTSVVIEATCNQVNQEGGYTGMMPQDFIGFVTKIARECDFDVANILFGGDHLGPNPWRHETAEVAMQKAQELVHAYVSAGFGKIHLDASMACVDDENPLPSETIAQRAAQLAKVAELAASQAGLSMPGYIIGTEVPVPGGATHTLDGVELTSPQSAAQTMALHKSAFEALGLHDALQRVVAIVVQPGVEFGHSDIVRFDNALAQDLINWRSGTGGLVFEAHSTDYQSAIALREMVEGGFAILKVGPGLTFAMREAFYALDQIAGHLCADYSAGNLMRTMEALMRDQPSDWQSYYSGDDNERAILRHFSYSDRIRYYWGRPEALSALDSLLSSLDNLEVPETLISQYLARCYDKCASGEKPAQASDLISASIELALEPYSYACSTSCEET